MDTLYEKTIHQEQIFSGRIITLQVDDVQLPDGNYSKREIVKHPGAVGIIALTKDKKILLVKQYRKPVEEALLEIPAGLREEGEDPETTAIRELEEETGYTTDQMTYVTSFYTSPGFSNEILHLYQAGSLERLESPVSGDEDEFIQVKALSMNEAKKYMKQNRIRDAKTQYALLYLQILENA